MSSSRIGSSPRGPGLSWDVNSAMAAPLAARSSEDNGWSSARSHGIDRSSGARQCHNQIG